MAKIYIPSEYLNKQCYIVNNDYIRVYDTTYTNQSNVVYDIYFKNDYMIKRNSANYNSNTLCDMINTYTDEIYYRHDFSTILWLFIGLCLVIFLIPIKTVFRFFKRFN